MAPPEHDKEPKAPDKSDPVLSDQVTIDIPPDEYEQNIEITAGTSCGIPTLEGNTQLESLDEGGLKELLQEAIAYKNPKDREGKSRLFNVLLEQAEQYDETGSSVGGRGRSGIYGDRRATGRAARYSAGGPVCGTAPRRDLPHSGSLQDLAAAIPSHSTTAVSHRAHSGGSLPCVGRVPTDYVATVRCVNPPPLELQLVSPSSSCTVASSSTVSATDDALLPSITSNELETDTTGEMDVGRSPKLPRIPVTYTARASFEIGAGNTGTRNGNNNNNRVGRAVTTTTSSLIDSKVGFGCITTPQVVTSSSTSSFSTSTPIIDATKPLQLSSGYGSVASITGVGSPPLGCSPSSPPASSSLQQSSSTITPHPIQLSYQPILPTLHLLQKSHDENGNSVQTFNHQFTTSSSQHSKKPKPNRKKNKETDVRKAEQIAGYQGFREIDDILKFIEPELDNAKHHHHKGTPRSAHKSRDDGEEKSGKKRSTERRVKEKIESKIKKANSMEEMSCSKLEDLTSESSKGSSLTLRKTKKQSTFDSSDGHDKKNDRRSWGNEGRESYTTIDIENSDDIMASSLSITPVVSQTSKEKKKLKLPNKTILSEFQTYEGVMSLPEPMIPFENVEFQTVTKKKKNRKRHSPYDESRGRGNKSYGSYPKEYLPGKNPNAEIIYSFRNQGSPEHRRKSASSVPPSDKSNDSNDDLDSVHSLPVESTAEKMSLQQVSASSGGTPQASYADIAKMANAIPPLHNNNTPSSPPLSQVVTPTTTANTAQETPPTPINNNSNSNKNTEKWPTISPKTGVHSNSSSPPNGLDTSANSSSSHTSIKSPPASIVSQSQIRGHNYPDIVESCTKTLESETRNLYQKETVTRTESSPAELQRNRSGKLKIVDAGTQVEATPNPAYDLENYPALDVKNSKSGSSKLKSDTKIFKTLPLFPAKPADKKVKVNVVKPTTKEHLNEETLLSPKDTSELITGSYLSFVKQEIVNNVEPITVVQFEHTKTPNVLKASMLHYKLDGLVIKPPDVLPVPEVPHDSIRHQTMNDHRPAVIILNEEVEVSNENVNEIEGLTFGFDINEQLLNGDNLSVKSSLENLTITDGEVKTMSAESESMAANQVPYNFNMDFPAINEKPHRENRQDKQKNVDDHRVAKRTNRICQNARESSTSAMELDEIAKENISSKILKISSETDDSVNKEEQEAKCDLVSDSAPNVKSLTNPETVEDRLIAGTDDISLRYLAPVAASNESYNLDKIIQFIRMAWEEVLKSPGGKVRYYGKQ